MKIYDYTMADYKEELSYINNTPSMSELIAREKAELEEEEKWREEMKAWAEEADKAYKNACEVFAKMLHLMDEQPSFENLVGVMDAYDMVSDCSKEVYGFRVRPTVKFTNPIATAIKECANRIPWQRWFAYAEMVNKKHSR